MRRGEHGTIGWNFSFFHAARTSFYRLRFVRSKRQERRTKNDSYSLCAVRTHALHSIISIFYRSIHSMSWSAVLSTKWSFYTLFYSPPDIRSNASDNVAHKKIWMNYGNFNILSNIVMIHSLGWLICDANMPASHSSVCSHTHLLIECNRTSRVFALTSIVNRIKSSIVLNNFHIIIRFIIFFFLFFVFVCLFRASLVVSHSTLWLYIWLRRSAYIIFFRFVNVSRLRAIYSLNEYITRMTNDR